MRREARPSVLSVELRSDKILSLVESTPLLRWYSEGMTVAGVSGVSGTAANQLSNPWGLAFDSSYALYVADRLNNRVQKWHVSATTGMTVAGQANATGGATLYDLKLPTFIQFDSSENIYVTDVGNHRVQFWHHGTLSGSTVAGTGKKNNIFYADTELSL